MTRKAGHTLPGLTQGGSFVPGLMERSCPLPGVVPAVFLLAGVERSPLTAIPGSIGISLSPAHDFGCGPAVISNQGAVAQSLNQPQPRHLGGPRTSGVGEVGSRPERHRSSLQAETDRLGKFAALGAEMPRFDERSRFGAIVLEPRTLAEAIRTLDLQTFVSVQHVFDASSEVADYARRLKIEEDIRRVADLCLREVPGATTVRIRLKRDPEDGLDNIVFTVVTEASIDAILLAEDCLHERIYEQINPEMATNFAVTYDRIR